VSSGTQTFSGGDKSTNHSRFPGWIRDVFLRTDIVKKWPLSERRHCSRGRRAKPETMGSPLSARQLSRQISLV